MPRLDAAPNRNALAIGLLTLALAASPAAAAAKRPRPLPTTCHLLKDPDGSPPSTPPSTNGEDQPANDLAGGDFKTTPKQVIGVITLHGWPSSTNTAQAETALALYNSDYIFRFDVKKDVFDFDLNIRSNGKGSIFKGNTTATFADSAGGSVPVSTSEFQINATTKTIKFAIPRNATPLLKKDLSAPNVKFTVLYAATKVMGGNNDNTTGTISYIDKQPSCVAYP